MKIEINKNNIENFSSFLTNEIINNNKEKLNNYNKQTVNKIIEYIYQTKSDTKSDFNIEELEREVIDTISAFKKKIKKLIDYLKTIKPSKSSEKISIYYETEYERARKIKLEDIDELNDMNIISIKIYLCNKYIIIKDLEFSYNLYKPNRKIFFISYYFSEEPFDNQVLYPQNPEETLFETKDIVKIENSNFRLQSSEGGIMSCFTDDMSSIDYFSKEYSYEIEQKLTSTNNLLRLDINVKTTEEKAIIKAVLNKEKSRIDYSINIESNFIKTLNKDIMNRLEKELEK